MTTRNPFFKGWNSRSVIGAVFGSFRHGLGHYKGMEGQRCQLVFVQLNSFNYNLQSMSVSKVNLRGFVIVTVPKTGRFFSKCCSFFSNCRIKMGNIPLKSSRSGLHVHICFKKVWPPPLEKMGGWKHPPLKTDLSKWSQNRPWLWTWINGFLMIKIRIYGYQMNSTIKL